MISLLLLNHSRNLEEPRGTCMKEMRPRLFRVVKKMWNEWTLDLKDG